MSAFGVFRASFDGALQPHQRRTGRAAAYIVTSVAAFVVAGIFLTILHLNANQLTDLANAKSVRVARAIDIDVAPGKACNEQSWPFIEGNCLISANSARKDMRALQPQAIASRQSESRKKKLHRNSMIVANSRVKMVTVGRIGRTGTTAQASVDDNARIPLPLSKPLSFASLQTQTTQKPPVSPPATVAAATAIPTATAIAAATATAAAATTPTAIATATPAPSPTIAAAPSPTPIIAPAPAPPTATHKPPRAATAVASRRPREQVHREAQRRDRFTREQREARAEMRRNDEQSARRYQYGYPPQGYGQPYGYGQAYGYAPQYGDWQRGGRTAQRGLFGGSFF